MNAKESSNLLMLTKEQQGILEDLKSRIKVTMDWDLNVVNVEAKMQDARVAAEVTEYTQDYITKYVKAYSVAKGMEQLKFVEQQLDVKRQAFEAIQMELAEFRDRNQFVTTARARSEEQRLESQYNIAYNVYNQLAQQRETTKIQINENTPVFTVLEPVKVPVEKSEPKRAIILIIFLVSGAMLSMGVVLVMKVNWVAPVK